MHIKLDNNKKLASLVKKDGTVISTYSFKRILSDTFTYEILEAEINRFNTFLEKQEEFDNIKGLSQYVNLFDFSV